MKPEPKPIEEVRAATHLTTRLLACAVIILVISGCALRKSPLTLRKVVLYQNGIGYFERQGSFKGQKLRIYLRAHELNDVLKTLTVIDRSAGGKPRPITAVIPNQESTGAKDKKVKDADRSIWLDVSLGHGGQHDLLIAYSVPTPTWKATYRLVLPEGDDRDKTLLQGWALVNNASGEDWRDVRLTLATGSPMTFAMDMRTPQFVARPDLSGRMVKPVTRGAVMSESAKAGDIDGDGIPDATDQCPSAAEDRDAFEDGDGCPDPDNDNDNIPDATDKCPNDPEAYNGFLDTDGCPDKGRVLVQSSRIEILDKIYFADGSDQIKKISRPIINAIAATLKGNPQISAIEIQGHASSAEDGTWGLSARRAGAIRAALKKLGVTTDLVARAYGSTRPISPDKTENGRSKNRRVEFVILKKGTDAPPRGPVTARAVRRSAHRGAKTAAVAGMVRYELPGAVSIGQGTTTMVTMINRNTSGQDVFLFRPDDNVPGSDRYPQRAAMIENSGKLTLEPGPVAIFARGTFVGEGLISRLHTGETAFIPYAVDSSSSVKVTSTTDEKPAAFISLVEGVATVENHDVRVTKYEVVTGSQTPKLMVVKHPRPSGYEVLDLPPGSRSTHGAVLIPFPVSPTKRSVLTVRERRPVRRTLWLRSGAGASRLELYLSASNLGRGDQNKLRQIIAAQQKVTRLSAKLGKLRARVSDVGVRGGELREGIKSVARTRGAVALRKKMLKLLSKNVTLMEEVTGQLTAVSLERSVARDELKKLIKSLRIEPGKGKSPAE